MKLKGTALLLIALTMCLSLTAKAQLNSPNGLAFDGSGNLWLANKNSNQLLELNPANGNVIHTIRAGLNGPTRVTFAHGLLFVANTAGNNITVYNPQTLKLVRTITNSAINKPLGVAVDGYGDVYVGNSQANTVIAINVSGGLVETLGQDKSGFQFVAPGAITIHGPKIYAGFGPGFGENAVISYNVGEFLTRDPQENTVYTDTVNTGPTGIAFDAQENVYIADFYSETWVKYSPDGKLLLVVKHGVLTPEGIALDSSGNVYVSNENLNNITVYNSSGTLINTLN
jgi:outer membrane protein assembly factor BamB